MASCRLYKKKSGGRERVFLFLWKSIQHLGEGHSKPYTLPVGRGNGGLREQEGETLPSIAFLDSWVINQMSVLSLRRVKYKYTDTNLQLSKATLCREQLQDPVTD